MEGISLEGDWIFTFDALIYQDLNEEIDFFGFTLMIYHCDSECPFCIFYLCCACIVLPPEHLLYVLIKWRIFNDILGINI